MTPLTIRIAICILGVIAMYGLFLEQPTVAVPAVTAIAAVLPGARDPN